MKDLDIRTRAFEGVLYRLDKLRSGFAMMAMLFFVLGSSLACDGRSPGGFGEGIPPVTQCENGDDVYEAAPSHTDTENGTSVEEQDDVDTGDDVLVNIVDGGDTRRREDADDHLDLEIKKENAPDTNVEDGPVNLQELNNNDNDNNEETINAVVDCAGDCGGNAVNDCFGVCGGHAVED